MARIGEAKRQSHESARDEHLARSIEERLRRGLALSVAAGATRTCRDDDPSPFYARARELGLYIA